MIFYIAIIIFFIGILIHQYVFYIRNYYSNVTVEKLREIRFNATLYLTKISEEALPQKHFVIYKGLIAFLDIVIQQFSKMKGGVIRFKDLKVIYPYIKLLTRNNGKIIMAIDGNEIAEEYVSGIRDVINVSAKAIPFFYLRIFWYLLRISIYYLLIKIGFKKLRNNYDNIRSTLELFNLTRDKTVSHQ